MTGSQGLCDGSLSPQRGFSPWTRVFGARGPSAFASWNAQGLLAWSYRRRDRKMGFLGRELAGKVVCLQEVHGDQAQLETELLGKNLKLLVFGTWIAGSPAAGGPAVLFPALCATWTSQ